MNRRTDSSSWKILSTSIESSGRRIPIEMESLCTSMPRWTNERCERLDTGRLLSAWGPFCLRVDDPRLNWQRSRPFHDDYMWSDLGSVALLVLAARAAGARGIAAHLLETGGAGRRSAAHRRRDPRRRSRWLRLRRAVGRCGGGGVDRGVDHGGDSVVGGGGRCRLVLDLV